MAEYYTLLMRAVEGLPNKTQTARRAVYDRARAALINQLRSLDPPISENDIVRERLSLDDAISRIEAELARGSSLEASPAETFQEDNRHILPEPEPIGSYSPINQEPSPSATHPVNSYDQRDQFSPERPRIAIVEREMQDKRSLRSILLASALAAVITSIAVSAWLLRDRPSAPLLSVRDNPVQGMQGEPKYSGRIGEDRPTTSAVSPSASSTNAVPAPGQAPLAQTPLAVAQRAILFEENPADPRSPKIFQGRTIWRFETVNPGQGQSVDNIVRAQLTLNEMNFSLSFTMRRNNDASLPASHIIELSFVTPSSDPSKAVRDVGLLQLKADEASMGSPLSGLPVPVKENIFLIGLSNLSSDQERNKSLILQRNWIDIPLRLASGQRAVLSLEKGSSGDQAFNEAFRLWSQ